MHPLLQLRLSTTFSSRQGSSRKCHLPLQPCFSEALFPWRGPAPKYLLHRSLPVPASPPLPPGGTPSPRRLPRLPLRSPPFHHLISLARVSPQSTTHPPPILPLRHPLLPAGNTPKNSFHIVPPSPPSPLSKTDLGAAFQRLPAAPGRFWVLSGFFGYFLGFSGCFLKKVGPKTSLFPPVPV